MFRKKFIISIILVAISSITLADGDAQIVKQPCCKGGFYIGLGISADAVKFKNHENFVTTFSNPQLPPFFLDQPIDLGGNGVDGQLFVGYGTVFENRYTLAAEAFGDLASAKGIQNSAYIQPTIFSAITTASLRLNNTVGIALLPGFMLNDFTTFYGRIGWAYSSFTRARSGLLPSVGEGILVGIPVSTSKNTNGIQLGLGLNAAVNDSFSIRGEYNWESYNEVNYHVTSTVNNQTINGFPTNEFLSGHAALKPRVQRFILAVVYHF